MYFCTDCANKAVADEVVADEVAVPEVVNNYCGVCGYKHKENEVTYWIECVGCKEWYDSAVDCVGFDEDEAEYEIWHCHKCGDR